MPADEVIQEETAIDRPFDEIREEIEDDEEEEDDLRNAGVERMMENIRDYPNQEDQIEKFCLPFLRSAQSDSAVDHVLENLKEKPHQTRL